MELSALIGISRLRMGTDGHGITTLVAFHGCLLRCKYCLNPTCLDPNAKTIAMSPKDVVRVLRKDEMYYVATKGGVTFGGGEPLLKSRFIKEVLELGAKEWNVTLETSLNVPWEQVEILLPYIDEYIVDIKDMNPEIYKRYTGRDNELVKANLKKLVDKGFSDRILCRIPLIFNHNDFAAQEKSKKELGQMGLDKFELFKYKTYV